MGKEGKMGMERELVIGGEHTIQCADDVLFSSRFETSVVLLSNITSMNSIK